MFGAVSILAGLVGIALLVNVIEHEVAKNIVPIAVVWFAGYVCNLVRKFRGNNPR